MARGHARLLTSIWSDDEFTALHGITQRTYMMVISQPNMSLAGVVPYTPRRWANLATDTKPAQIVRAVQELCDHRFLLADDSTEELWVRTFVRHDGLLKIPNMVKAMWKDYAAIQSPIIRQAFQWEYEELFEERSA